MVLKSLILQGFKSFPDRTEIKFLGGSARCEDGGRDLRRHG